MMGGGRRSGATRVVLEDQVQCRTGQALAGLMQPGAGNDGVPERAPDTGNAPGTAGHGHEAGGRAADQRQRALHGACVSSAEPAQHPGLGVDQPGRDRRARRQPPRRGGRCREAAMQAPHRARWRGQCAKPGQPGQAQPIQDTGLPALARQVGPFASEPVQRVRVHPGGVKRDRITQIPRTRHPRPGVRVPPGQPGELGQVDFRRHAAAIRVQQRIPARGEFVRFRVGPVIHPAQHVRIPGQRRGSGVGQGEGGRRVDRDRLHHWRVRWQVRVQAGADRFADRLPNVGEAIHGLVLGRAQQGEAGLGGGQQRPVHRQQPGAGGKRADIDRQQRHQASNAAATASSVTTRRT